MYSSKLSVGIHILCLVAREPCPITSDYIAGSIGTNPALVRRLMSKLKSARLLNTQTKLGATGLAKPAEQISLLEVFRAVEPQRSLFDIHTGTNPNCPVGAHINGILTRLYGEIQNEMEARLGRVKLSALLQQFPEKQQKKDKNADPGGSVPDGRRQKGQGGIPMKIAIIGATGMAGRAVFKEAQARGHEAAAIVRNGERARQLLGNGARVLAKDAFELTKEDLSEFDVVVDAFSAPPEKAYLHVELAAKLVALFRGTQKPRLFFILGAGSLLDENGRPFVETLRRQPGAESWVAIPEAQFRELEFLRGADNVNWVGISPSAVFQEGERHSPKLGKDHLLSAEDGGSHVTNATAAAAILDEIEHPSVRNGRFTVSD